MNEKALIEYGQERRVTADEVMEIIAAENYCNSIECDHCQGAIKAAIRTLADARMFESDQPFKLQPDHFYTEGA